jgi:predicted nucleic acid-binding protein
VEEMIFLDTGFLMAVEVDTDHYHDQAMKILKDISSGVYGGAYTSDYIFDEAVTLIAARTNDISRASKFGDTLKESSAFVLVEKGILKELGRYSKIRKMKDSVLLIAPT